MNAFWKTGAGYAGLAALVSFILLAGAGQGAGGENGPAPAYITLVVPADAQVWFDDEKTGQTGMDRVFNSPDLQPGRRYFYNVKARWTANGKRVTRTRKVRFHAGERVTVDFLSQ